MKLGKIADLNIGLVLARKKVEEYKSNKIEYKSLSLKSIDSNGIILKENLEKFYSKERLNDEMLTKFGDVVIRVSEPYTAAYIDSDYEGIVIPVNYAVIRLKSNKIKPEFLKFYINSKEGKKSILRVCEGTMLKTISIANLKDLSIKVCSIEKQNQFININKLAIRENELLNKLISEKSKYLDVLNKELLK